MQDHEAWLEIAAEDLRSAKILFENDALNNSAYCTQQCAEKSLKAYLVSKKHKIEKTHDLVYLLKICFNYEPTFWSLFHAAKALNPFATRSRYPDDFEVLEGEDVHALIEKAEEIFKFARSKIK